MKEFIEAMSLALTGFPPVLTNILTAGGGALVSVIIAARTSAVPMSLLDMIGQFIVCWLTGGILGPSVCTPLVQSIANKMPDYAISFLSSGIGWWFWVKYIPKQQEDILNKPPGGAPPTQNP